MSSIQSEQDAMLEKVKKSQAELLLINRNIAGNLKKLRQDQVDIGQKANVNQQLIVHLIDQALVMESTLSQHMETTTGKNKNLNNISVNLNQSQITDRHKTSYMSSQSQGGTSRRYHQTSRQGDLDNDNKTSLSKVNDQLKRCQIALFRYR